MSTHSAQFVCDNLVMRENGRAMIAESMFSASADLSTDHGELLARLHPVKKALFDLVHSGADVLTTMRTKDGRSVETLLHKFIQIHVNRPDGKIQNLDYAVVARSTSTAIGEAHGRGFEPGAEPVIRQMPDRSFRLVFCAMPPLAHKLGTAFDMDHFGDALVRLAGTKLRWEDRDLFWISNTATADDIGKILAFLKNYDGK